MIARLEGMWGRLYSLQPAFSGFLGSARKPAAGRIASPTLKTQNAHPKVSILRHSLLSQGDVHGRIRFDGFATGKTCM
jgi:hypothetical protein